jgi:hypothetical protein
MGFDDAVKYADLVKRLQACETAPDLVAEWKKVWDELTTDKIDGQEGKRKMTVVYTKCKDKFKVK